MKYAIWTTLEYSAIGLVLAILAAFRIMPASNSDIVALCALIATAVSGVWAFRRLAMTARVEQSTCES